MLARHLYMHEVLEICEMVHKQMEEKQLTLYQQGDVHTVALENNMLNVHFQEQMSTHEQKTTSPVVIEVTNDQQILNENSVQCQTAAQIPSTNDLVAIASQEQAAMSTHVSVAFTSDNVDAASVDGTTAVYISNIPNDSSELQSAVFVPAVIEVASGQPQSHQIVVECLDAQPSSLIDQHAASDVVLKENTMQTDVSSLGLPCLENIDIHMDVAEDDTVNNEESLKRKHYMMLGSPNSPGRDMISHGASTSSEGAADVGARTQIEVASYAETSSSIQDSPSSSDGSQYRGKLRERSIEEGGYIQMHRGKGRKHQSRKLNHKSAVQQVRYVNKCSSMHIYFWGFL